MRHLFQQISVGFGRGRIGESERGKEEDEEEGEEEGEEEEEEEEGEEEGA